MDNEARALRQGTLIHERYQIQRILGAGGFGITYEAWDIKEGMRVALKEYMPLDIAVRKYGMTNVLPVRGQESQYERFRTRFLDEAKVIYQYRNHPNIVHVHHLFYENNTAYYVMEYMEGDDLGKVMEGKILSWQIFAPIVVQTVRALSAVHQTGMIHCDVSPDNIFIQKNGCVKVIDFGAAKHVLKGQSSVIILKKGYAPPEQFASNGNLGPWTDIYALAVTIYRACTGKMPPAAPERLVQDQTIWPSQMGYAVPFPKWEMVLKRGMALRIEERYSEVEKFWEDLNQTQGKILVLEGVRGIFAGRKIPIRGTLYLGTDSEKCNIIYPPGSPGISRQHIRFVVAEESLMAVDLGSTYGTFLDGTKMTPGRIYTLKTGAIIEMGDREMFQISHSETS